MPDDPVDRLLECWYELFQQGRMVAPEDLTRNPELLPLLRMRIAMILRTDAALGAGPPPVGTADYGVPGRYTNLRYHAGGGMGIVYRAYDLEAQREVAYKVIRAELADDPVHRERFLREAKLTAVLGYPGVVPIYGVTTDTSGRPSYAMRLIQGDAWDEAVVRFHKTKPLAHEAAVWRPLLSHFIRIVRTIQHAHDKGVLHRDLGPRNVIVTNDDESYVIDWGLASRQDLEREPSGSPTRAGTVAFTAPEVWQDGVDAGHSALSDVYSLGALLYLCLTNRPPYSGATTTDLIALVLQGPPKAVESLCPQTPLPLSAVCARAMSRSKQDRYATAEELASDVEKWLAGDPVTAYPMPRWERTWRWCSRHRPLIAAVATLCVALSVAGPLVAWRQEKLRIKAEASATLANEQREVAKKEHRRLQDAVRAMIAQADGMGRLRAPIPGTLALLDRTLRQVTEFANSVPDSEEERALAVDCYIQVGWLLLRFDERERAKQAFERARELSERLLHDNDAEPAHRNRLAASLCGWGVAKGALGDVGEAEEAWKRAKNALGPPSNLPATHRNTLVKVYIGLGNLSMGREDYAKAEENFAEAIRLAIRLVKETPDEPSYRITLAEVYSNHGWVLMRQAMPQEIGAQNAVKHRNPKFLRVINDAEKLRAAEKTYQKALREWEDLVDGEPENLEHKARLAAVHYNLGNVRQNLGEERLDDAEANYREAIKLYEPNAVALAIIPDFREEMVCLYGSLIEIRRKRGSAEAVDMARQSVEVFARIRRAYPSQPEHAFNVAVAYERLALATTQMGPNKETESNYLHSAIAFANCFSLEKDGTKGRAAIRKTLEMLREARQAAPTMDTDFARCLREDPAFAVLGNDPDFVKFREEALGK